MKSESQYALVCWSGGCDSTLTLLQLLQKRTVHVRTISVSHCQVPAQDEQRAARTAIKAELEAEFGRFHSFEVSISSGENVIAGGLCQPAIWLPAAVIYLYGEEDLYCGYIRGDDVWHYKQEVYMLFKGARSLLNKSGRLRMPLEFHSKADVIRELRGTPYYAKTFWCEDPVAGQPCGRCHPCTTHQMYARLVETEDERNRAACEPVCVRRLSDFPPSPLTVSVGPSGPPSPPVSASGDPGDSREPS